MDCLTPIVNWRSKGGGAPPAYPGGRGEVKWETTMEKAIERAAREPRKSSPQAAAASAAGPVEYVSKADAAAIVEGIITDLLTDGRGP